MSEHGQQDMCDHRWALQRAYERVCVPSEHQKHVDGFQPPPQPLCESYAKLFSSSEYERLPPCQCKDGLTADGSRRKCVWPSS